MAGERVEYVRAELLHRDVLAAMARLYLVECGRQLAQAGQMFSPAAVEAWRANAEAARAILDVATTPGATLVMPHWRQTMKEVGDA